MPKGGVYSFGWQPVYCKECEALITDSEEEERWNKDKLCDRCREGQE